MAAIVDEKRRGELAASKSQVTGKVVGLYEGQIISADGSVSAVAEADGNGVAVQETGTVFMASGSELAREGALSGGAHVVDVGDLTLKQLRSVVKCYNESPWTTKEGLDAAVGKADELADEEAVAAPAAAGGEAPEGKGDDSEAAGAGISAEEREKFLVYDDDACLGKPAPQMDALDFIHGEATNLGSKDADGKITVVVFWAKFAKGDYTTVNEFSRIAKANPDIQVVGVSCDPKKEEAAKFVKKIGTFQAELGDSGLTIEADFALAFDPDRDHMRSYKAASKLMSVGVGMTFLVNPKGVIVWREQYTRGKSTVGQLEEQIAKLKKGEPLLSNGVKEVDSDDEGEEVACSKPVVKAPGEDY